MTNNLQFISDHQCIEYVWIDGIQGLRSKTKILSHQIFGYNQNEPNKYLHCIPMWNFDGSSTKQASGKYSEVLLKPVSIFRDPFRKDHHLMVLCETLNPDGTPSESNTRHEANELFLQKQSTDPWFGLECEFFIMKDNGTFKSNTPTATTNMGLEAIQGQYYCGVGCMNVRDRDVVEHIMRACCFAGVQLSGINCEVGPSQYEYQVGIVKGIQAGDHMWMSRYIAERVGELYNKQICWDPKPIKNFNGSGCHVNFSTVGMRNANSMEFLEAPDGPLHQLAKYHKKHMENYGKNNQERMTGKHETSSFGRFTWGRGDRTASIRIPSNSCEYIEDRRPAANMDPYVVTGMIYKTVVLDSDVNHESESIQSMTREEYNKFVNSRKF